MNREFWRLAAIPTALPYKAVTQNRTEFSRVRTVYITIYALTAPAMRMKPALQITVNPFLDL